MGYHPLVHSILEESPSSDIAPMRNLQCNMYGVVASVKENSAKQLSNYVRSLELLPKSWKGRAILSKYTNQTLRLTDFQRCEYFPIREGTCARGSIESIEIQQF